MDKFLSQWTGIKERQDRIAELEGFINDQATELDEMEKALKQTIFDKEKVDIEVKNLQVIPKTINYFIMCVRAYVY